MKICNKIVSIMLIVTMIMGIIQEYTYAGDLYIDYSTKNQEIKSDKSVNEMITVLEEDGFEFGRVNNEIVVPKEPVDLSSEYLPAVENQIGGSCGAFSSIYYQYSYEVNRKKDLKGTNALVYSPYFIYSYLCTEAIRGICKCDAFSLVQERGCLQWNEFYNSGENCKIGYSTNVAAMRNALNTKINHFYQYLEVYKENEQYTTDQKLFIPKLLLSNGIMLSVSYGTTIINSMEYNNHDVVYRIGSEQYEKTGKHEVTIVGYDDNFTCNVNGDKDANGKDIIDKSEMGAFKVVNSWGDTYNCDGGYFWVMYDAVVNAESKIPCTGTEIDIPYVDFVVEDEGATEKYYLVTEQGEKLLLTSSNWKTILGENYYIRPDDSGKPMWDEIKEVLEKKWGITNTNELQDFSDISKKAEEDIETYTDNNQCLPSNWDEILTTTRGARKRMFSAHDFGVENNNFNSYYFITVKDSDVTLVGQVDYQLDNRSDYQISFSRGDNTENVITPKYRNSITDSIQATEVFDLTELLVMDGVVDLDSTWKATITTKESGNCEKFDFILTDKCGKVIPTIEMEKPVSDECKKEITLGFDIQCGDNNYDGYLTVQDFESYYDRTVGLTSDNALQEALYDCNRDGKIDCNDTYEMFYTAYDAIYKGNDTYVKMTKEDLYSIMGTFGYGKIGDVTLDGLVDYQDVEALGEMLSGGYRNSIQKILGDVDKDGQLRWSDYTKLSRELYYVDVNQNGYYTIEDINAVLNHLRGDTLPVNRQRLVDFDSDGIVETEEYYMLLYGYYLNLDNYLDVNPNFTPYLKRYEFYDDHLAGLQYRLGDLDKSGVVDSTDLNLFQKALEGDPESYIHLILADLNQDLVLDEEDEEIFENDYMSDFPFTYVLDEDTKTMTLTGVRENTIACIKIAEQYTVNCEQYTVTGIADNAFSDCANLEEVYIPDSVTEIAPEDYRHSPFYEAGNMALKIYCEAKSKPDGFTKYWNGGESSEFGYTMEEVGDYFYYKADSEHKTLEITGVKGNWYMQENETVCIDDRYLVNGEEYRVTAIGDYAFNYEGNIVSMELPSGITVIGEGAFSEMEHLENIDLMRCVHLKEIKASAFAYCDDLERVWIPNSVEVIHSDTVEESIFYQCSDDLWVLVDSTYSKEGWGDYWNYLDEDTVADTEYVGAPFA